MKATDIWGLKQSIQHLCDREIPEPELSTIASRLEARHAEEQRVWQEMTARWEAFVIETAAQVLAAAKRHG